MITHFFDTPYSSNSNVCTISPGVEASQGFDCPGFIQPNKQTNKQKIWRILRWIRSEIGTTNARQCQVPVWRDHTICPRILRKYSHTKYHQQCITIPIYSDIDHSNTQYSSTLEVSKKLRFLDANCLSDALAFQKKICGSRRKFFWQQHFARFWFIN
jgi:hypothetical protein